MTVGIELEVKRHKGGIVLGDPLLHVDSTPTLYHTKKSTGQANFVQ